MTNIIDIYFDSVGSTATAPSKLWQWSKGQVVRINGLDLPTVYQVHFSNNPTLGTAEPVAVSGNMVSIPDIYLTTGEPVYLFIWLSDETSAETIRKGTIYVAKRSQPSGEYDPTAEQQTIIDGLIGSINTAVDTAEGYAESAQTYSGNAATSATEALNAKDAAQGYAEQASQTAQGVEILVNRAEYAADDAETAKQDVEQLKQAVEGFADDAESAKTDAETARGEAQGFTQTATTKASEASQSASQASQSATTAAEQAQTATAKATEASQSAETATAKASEASASATTATAKASEASASASTATTAKNDAVTAKNAAITARTGAETARTGAETAAQSVSASAAQIATNTSDIADLKADLSNNAVSKNLLGSSAGVLYPCFISANKKVTLYTSDNETGVVFEFSTYDKDGVRTHYWNIPNVSTSTSRTVTVPDNAYYVSWTHINQKMTGLPMCEIGDKVTGFAEWFPPVKTIQEEIEDLTEDLDITPYTTVDGYLNPDNGRYVYSDSFQISKYQVTSGDVLVLDVAFPYASRGGVFQFQNNVTIPSSDNTYIVGKRYTEAFEGLMIVPEGATWLMVSHPIGINNNTVKVRKPIGIANLEEAVEALDNVDKVNYDYKLRNFKQVSDQYKKGNTSGTWYDRFVLFHISDNHVGNTSTSFPARNLSELTNISNDVKVDVVVNSGDMTIAGSSTLTRDDVNVMFDNFTDLSTNIESQSIPIIATLGNHDANDISTALIAHATTKADQWDHMFEAIKNKYPAIVWGDSTGKKHYHYYDITKGSYKLRIIALDSLDHADYVEGDSSYDCQHYEVYSQSQIDWFCNTALQVPDASYGVIVVNHYPFAPRRTAGYSEEYPALNDGYFAQGWKMIPEIVRAWTGRTTLTKTYADNKLGLNNINVNVDFSGVPTGALFVCYMAGHTHSKNAFVVKEENGENFGQLMLCEDSSGQQGMALNRVYKYDDGIQNTAASQVTIDMAERKVYRTAYGAYQHCSEAQKFPTAIFEF